MSVETMSVLRVIAEDMFQGLIKGINMLDEKYGSVYMDFCEPISAHEFVWSLSDNRVSYTNRDLPREQEQIVHLAHCVVSRWVRF